MADCKNDIGKQATTAEGYFFDPSSDVWLLGSGPGAVRFDFAKVPAISVGLRGLLKAVLLTSVTTMRASLAYRDLHSIRAVLRHVAAVDPPAALESLHLDHVKSYANSLPDDRKYLVIPLIYALQRWTDSGVAGLAKDLLNDFTEMEVSRRVSGQAVRTCSPSQGALTKHERDSLLSAVDEYYAAGLVCLSDYCMALLMIVLGVRPYQIACLKVCDLLLTDDPDVSARLRIPRAKQGGFARSEFTLREIVPDLAERLHQQSCEARAWAHLHDVDPDSAPMFPGRIRHGRSSPPRLPGMSGHMDPSVVSNRMSNLFRGLDVLQGLPGRGHITAVRLRRTVATILVAEGWSLDEIAGIMDHDAVSSTLTYIQPTPELADLIDRALGDDFADLISGFQQCDSGTASEPIRCPMSSDRDEHGS